MGRSISADDRLRYLGLMKMAQEHTRETRKIELAIHAMLGTEDGSHISDAIYSRYNPNDTVAELDAVLKREGIEVIDGDEAA